MNSHQRCLGLFSLLVVLVAIVSTCGHRHLFAPTASPRLEEWPMFRGNPQRTGFAAVDCPGPPSLAWTWETKSAIAASPVLSRGYVCVASRDKNIHVLEQDGRSVGHVSLEGSISSTPALIGGKLFVGTEHPQDYLYALDMTSGRTLWKKKTIDVVSSPVVISEMVLFGSGDGALQAARVDSGQTVWSLQTRAQIYSSPAISDDVVVVGSLDHSVYAMKFADGNILWSYSTRGPVDASPAIGGGLVFFGSADSTFYALDLATGTCRWSFPTGGAIHTSAAIDESTCYFGSDDGSLHALGKEDGRHQWAWEGKSIIRSSPAVNHQAVFFGTHDGRFCMIDKRCGKLLWKYETGRSITSSPALSAAGVYVGCDDGRLYAFRFEQ